MVNGKPTGQTMGIKKMDGRHTVAVLRFQGKEAGILKGEISPDGKVLMVENEYGPRTPAGSSESRSSTGTGSNDHRVTLRATPAEAKRANAKK